VPRTLSHRLVGAFVALTAIVVYSNTLSYGAAWDDSRVVLVSGASEGVSGIPAMFRHPFSLDVPVGRSPYRPLTAVSYALDWTVGGGEASFFHWSNVALHALVSALVVLLLFRLGATTIAAALGGVVFAVHPVHVEVVANITGRSELLVGLFGVTAAVLYLGAGRGLGLVRALAILLLVGAAMLSKEHGIMLPAVLLAVEVLRPDADGSPLRRVVGRWPLWAGVGAVGVGYMLARRAVLGAFTTADMAPFIAALPPWHRVTTAVANWTEYARLHIFPLDLTVDYGPAVILPSTPADLPFWAGLAVAGLAVACAVWAYRQHRLGTLGLAWFAIVASAIEQSDRSNSPVDGRALLLPALGGFLHGGCGAGHVDTDAARWVRAADGFRGRAPRRVIAHGAVLDAEPNLGRHRDRDRHSRG
jgi:hypothetical protein